MAASEGDNEMIFKLVKEEGISPSLEFQHGITALHEACEGGHVEATQLLIDLGADVSKQVLKNSNCSALDHIWCIIVGSIYLVQIVVFDS